MLFCALFWCRALSGVLFWRTYAFLCPVLVLCIVCCPFLTYVCCLLPCLGPVYCLLPFIWCMYIRYLICVLFWSFVLSGVLYLMCVCYLVSYLSPVYCLSPCLWRTHTILWSVLVLCIVCRLLFEVHVLLSVVFYLTCIRAIVCCLLFGVHVCYHAPGFGPGCCLLSCL